jgi:hypothetical protein
MTTTSSAAQDGNVDGAGSARQETTTDRARH